MAKKEKFGKFVLLEEIDSSGLGVEYRAAKLGQAGLEKIVSIVQLPPSVSSHGEVAKSLMDQAKVAAQLQSPNIVKIYGIGKVDTAYYISYEFIEGKSLKAIFNRCRHEGFPFSVDHTLLIASKICSALEYAHGRKTDAGGRYFHGLMTPGCIIVSYEGEVRARGFGYWPGRVRETGLAAEDSLYLAPEQDTGGPGDTRSDIFAVGAILFETLTGHPLFESGRTQDVAGRLAAARLQSPTGDDDTLPKPIADILQRSLSVDPAGRYAEIQEMRKAIDTLLFSGDFTPTTFNLAFFMHSLFREDIERESKALKEEKEASYLEYLTGEEASKTGSFKSESGAFKPVGSGTAAGVGTVVIPAVGAALPPPPPAPTTLAASPLPLIPPPPRHEPIRHGHEHHEAPQRETHAPPPVPHGEPGVSAKEAAAGFTFHKDEAKSKLPLYGGIAALVLLAAGGGYFVFGRGGPSTPPTTQAMAPTTMNPEVERILAEKHEIEEKLRKLEEANAAAEQKAKDEATAKVKKEAQAKGQAVDPAALEKAQKEAADKARADQEKKAQEEKRRLEEERKAADKAAEEARIAAEKAAQEEAARKAAEAAATTLAPTTVAAALKPGSLVNLSDAGVTVPVVERKPALTYPPIALRQRVEGTVELNVLVDEKGVVVDAQVVSGAGGRSGLTEAAVDLVKKYKYRPATKEGVPVKVWVPLKVTFVLPKS